VLDPPASRWPARGFGDSLAVLLEVIDGLYRLPLLQAAHQRYGVAAVSSGRPLALWLGAA
jgi:hypothetical protein